MASDEVTCWFHGLAKGDEAAAEEVWRHYYEKLVRFARGKLAEGQRRAADEEDVALSAFHSFCRGAAAGRFPQLEDRHDLWKLLVTITARKAAHQIRRDMQQKRGSGSVRGESVFVGAGDSDRAFGIGNMLGTEPTPEFAVMAAEECEHLLEALPDEQIRQIALWKLEGFTNEEIAEKLDCAPRTVERKLQRIRDLWGREGE
ncbi:MAG: RNA polymerase subunit sigma-70 [Planctomycetaceae bacterium]|nr:RNA polymerase subunit sigma-70 [Planctomycetaceae bacterium]